MSVLLRFRPRPHMTRHGTSSPRSVSTALLSRRPIAVYASPSPNVALANRTSQQQVRFASFIPRFIARQAIRMGVLGAGGVGAASGAALYANNKLDSFLGQAGDFADKTWKKTTEAASTFGGAAGGVLSSVNDAYASAAAAADDTWESLAGNLSSRLTEFRERMRERAAENEQEETKHDSEHGNDNNNNNNNNNGFGYLSTATAAAGINALDNEEDPTAELMNLTAKLIEIRTLLQSIDHNDSLMLPSIVVVGSQSSGKSSVLEAIVGHQFLPKGDNMVTRRPIELTLVHTPATKLSPVPEEYAEIPTFGPGKITDFTQVQKILTELNLAVSAEDAVSEEPIYLQIHSPRVPNLSLVDLPGYVQVASADQPEHLRKRIQGLCDKYIRSPNIILAVCAANVDLANSASLRASRLVDPHGVRTIGVVTKLDLVDPEYGASVLNNSRYPLKLGYVGVVCKPPSASALKSEGSGGGALSMLRRGSTDEQHLYQIVTRQERDYFNTNRSYYQDSNLDVTTDVLKRRLTEVLERSMASSLLSISNAVDVELAETRYKFKVQYNDRQISAESYVAETMDQLKSRIYEFQKEYNKKKFQQYLKKQFDSTTMDVLTLRYFQDVASLLELYNLGNSSKVDAQDLDPKWHYTLDLATSDLTKSSVGRTTTNSVKDILEKSVEHLLQEDPLPQHRATSEQIKDIACEIIDLRLPVTEEQVENSIKPLKYEVDVDDREWEQGRQRAVELLKQDLDNCKKLLDVNKKEGGKKLAGAMEYVHELEEEAKRKAAALAKRKAAGENVDESQVNVSDQDDYHRPSFSPYMMAKAKETLYLDKLVGILQMRMKAVQSRRCKSGVQNKPFCPEVFLNVVADKLAYTSVNFINIELLLEFFYKFPRAIDVKGNADDILEFAKENPKIREHLNLQERKEKLEKVSDELAALIRVRGAHQHNNNNNNSRTKERKKGGLFGFL